MLKRRSKHFALLLVLTMLATMFVGVGTASAATENVALTVPNVGTSGVTSLGTLKVRETSATIGSIAAGQQITVNLPAGVEYVTAPTLGNFTNYVTPDGVGLVAGNLTFESGSTKSLTISISGRANPAVQAELSFLFNVATFSQVDLDSPDADIAIEIYAPSSGITSGKVIVAKSASAGTTTTVMETKTVANGTNKTIGTIRVAENRGASLAAGDQIKIVAPDDITIKTATVTPVGWPAVGLAAPATVVGTPALNSDGYSQVIITINTPTTTTPGFVNVELAVDVDDRDLTGALDFTVKGDNVTTQKVTVGKVADYTIEVAAKGDAKTVKAGFSNQELQEFTITEGLAGSFVDGRDFVLELPSWAHWYASPSLTRDKGNGTIAPDQAAAVTYDNNRCKITFTYTQVAAPTTPTKTKYTFEDVKVFIDPDAPAGDLKVIADGKALGGKYEVVLGKVVKPVSATASKADVKIGLANQAAPDITITEAAAGMLKYQVTEVNASYDKTALTVGAGKLNANQNAILVVDLPDGVKFSQTPTVKVTAGNLKLKDDDVKLTSNDNQLSIPIDKTSSEASTIVISDIKYTLDRTVPEGDVNVKITGNAVDNIAGTAPFADFNDAVITITNVTTVTPAPGDYKNEVSFVIGASSYKLNGVDQAMDVAPYIKDSRTYMPIRYVAYALGITDANILWDGSAQTVTLMKGDKVVQLKVGSKAISINGAAVTMDVAPEITSSRTMLPISFVANAFGATAAWDAATQTVTIK